MATSCLLWSVSVGWISAPASMMPSSSSRPPTSARAALTAGSFRCSSARSSRISVWNGSEALLLWPSTPAATSLTSASTAPAMQSTLANDQMMASIQHASNICQSDLAALLKVRQLQQE